MAETTEPSNTVDTYLRTRTYEELLLIILETIRSNRSLAKRLKMLRFSSPLKSPKFTALMFAA